MVARENRERESDTGSRNPVAINQTGHCWMDSVILAPRKGVNIGSVQWCPFGSKPKGERMGVYKKQGNWWIDFYNQGKRVRRKVGASKKVAEMALADIQVKKAKNEFLGICEPKRILFKDFAEEYLAYSKANKAKSSHLRDVTIIKTHILPMWGEMHLGKISSRIIEDYKVQRLQSVTAPTFNRELNTIKNLFRKAVEWGHLKENPTQVVKWIKTGKRPFRFLCADEIELLLEACRQEEHPIFYAVVVTALNTGMRRGEVLSLRWENVDFKRQQIQVVNGADGHTKNYESRVIPMNRTVIDLLKRQPRRLDSPYVFWGESGNPFCKTPYHFVRSVKRAGIPYVRFHDLRHTFASNLVMKGIDLRTVQELLGHKDMRMTLKYAHLAPDHVRKAVEVLDAPQRDIEPVILDSHYLDTSSPEQENQDAASQA
jgi:integrase